jgi:hypothetical protein
MAVAVMLLDYGNGSDAHTLALMMAMVVMLVRTTLPLAPSRWIIRIGPGAQPDQPENLKLACALRVEPLSGRCDPRPRWHRDRCPRRPRAVRAQVHPPASGTECS